MGVRRVIVAVCLGIGMSGMLAVAPSVSQAQPGGKSNESDKAKKPDYKAARAAYRKADAAFKKSEFKIAAREYAVAYAITKDPVLFYKIAESHERAGDCSTALVYYGRYTREGDPDPEYARQVAAAEKRCGAGSGTGKTAKPTGSETTETTGSAETNTSETGAAAAGSSDTSGENTSTGGTSGLGGATSSTPSGKPMPPPFDDRPRWKRTAAWASIGITVAAATTGAVLGLSAASRQEDIENLLDFRDQNGNPRPFDGAVQKKYDDLVDEGDNLDKLSKIAFGVAGVAAVSAVLFFVLDDSPNAESRATAQRIVPTIGPRGELGVAMGWQF